MAGHTEKEAAELWCPHARNVTDVRGTWQTGNRVEYDFPTCIGSRCSQWRWNINELVIGDLSRGFCGLAGRP